MPTTYAELLAADAEREEVQRHLNAYANGTYDAPEKVAAVVREVAEREHERHPQYRGYWDGWVPVRVKAHARGKGGVQFEAGDVTIGKYSRGLGYAPGTWVLYSVRRGWNCSGSTYSVERIAQ